MMTAEAIHNRIHGEGYCDPPCGLCLEVQELLDSHAHELAEKIRVELPERVKERVGDGIWEIRTIPTAKQAADLIDPKVNR
jgi:hypothetical protein